MKFKIIYIFICFTILNFKLALSSEIEAGNQNGSSLGSIVLPNAYSGTPGTATFLGPLATAQRTYQLLINQSELTAIAGEMIESITFRLPASATSDWPAAEVIYTNYDIYLSGSVAPQDRSLTFINNVVGVQKQVRSGSLTIPINSFTYGFTPNAFGMEIEFDSAYLYTGGHLLIEIRHNGFTGTSRSVDAIGTATSGYGTLFSACWAGSYTGTSGAQGNFAAVKVGASGVVGVHELSEAPGNFNLSQNYPNPFNPTTNIEFSIPKQSIVKITVYDSRGREVGALLNQELTSGTYRIKFDGTGYSSGVYHYRIEAGNFIQSRSMILLK